MSRGGLTESVVDGAALGWTPGAVPRLTPLPIPRYKRV